MLDSSVLIAAMLSPAGGSFYIILTFADRYRFLVSEYILTEVRDVLSHKLADRPELNVDLQFALALGEFEVLPVEPVSRVRRLYQHINREDAPILVSALAHARYLLSHDKHFLDKKVTAYADQQGLIICTPGTFIQRYAS